MSHPDLSATEMIAASSSEDALPTSGPTWQEQDGRLRDMWLGNQPPQVISEALGRSVAAIMTRAARLGLPRRASPGRKPGQRRFDQQGAGQATTARTPARMPVIDKMAPPQTSLRVCLMCLNKFESLGRHNRICSSCRNSSEYESASSLPEIHFSAS